MKLKTESMKIITIMIGLFIRKLVVFIYLINKFS